ncbi:MAG TPA: hypothetical protein IAC40_06400 [Candidatus Faecivivens stercorigallinarum]|nr:hypothetical protein [Candidatus Faecivivens stercorigallinarum]
MNRGKRKAAIRFGVFSVLAFILIGVAIFGPLMAPFDPLVSNYTASLSPPDALHLCGTDKLGRDVLSRILCGAGSSFFLTFVMVVLVMVIGTLIGMATALQPSVLLCDEPTSALDVTSGAQAARLLRNLCDSQGISILMVTHNIGLAAAIGDRIAVMYRGELVEEGTGEQIMRSPSEEYTARLLTAVPRLDR